MTTSHALPDPIEVTKTVYTVLDFVNWQRDGLLNLRPYFQRGSVWTSKAKSFLIDTLLRGYPIPVIYLQNKVDSKSLKNVRQVIDGQQRLRTILSFIDPTLLLDASSSDRFTISRAHNRELAGANWSKLPPDLQDRLLNTEVSVHILPASLQDKLLLELFARLNSTGERLNDQELRNAEFHGVFKGSAYGLANDALDIWTDWGLFPARALTQMKHVEFTSELMLYLLNGLQAKSKAALDSAYRAYDDDFPQSDDVERVFREVIDLVARALEQDSSTQPLKKLLTQSWIYAIFAYLASATRPGPLAGGRWALKGEAMPTAELRRRLIRLETRLQEQEDLPEELEKALRGASTDVSSRIARIKFLSDAFAEQ